MAQSRAQRELTRAKASLPTAGLPIVTTLTSAAGHCSAAHTPHSVACAQCFSDSQKSGHMHATMAVTCTPSGCAPVLLAEQCLARLRDSSIGTEPQGLQAAEEGV